MKIVINADQSAFNISKECLKFMHQISPDEPFDEYDYAYDDILRASDTLVKAVEYLGTKQASGYGANLKIVTIPDYATDYRIAEYDGLEYVFYVVNGKIHVEC